MLSETQLHTYNYMHAVNMGPHIASYLEFHTQSLSAVLHV